MFRLCYVENSFAYFTNIEPFSAQWGDDWNDAPYEHNAGDPYEWAPYMADGDRILSISEYIVFKIAYEGELVTPSEGLRGDDGGTVFSVQDINERMTVPWLCSPQWVPDDEKIEPMYAGIGPHDFIARVRLANGTVFLDDRGRSIINADTLPSIQSRDTISGRWRVGRRNHRAMYIMVGDGPSDDDTFIGALDTPELARAACNAVNLTKAIDPDQR